MDTIERGAIRRMEMDEYSTSSTMPSKPFDKTDAATVDVEQGSTHQNGTHLCFVADPVTTLMCTRH